MRIMALVLVALLDPIRLLIAINSVESSQKYDCTQIFGTMPTEAFLVVPGHVEQHNGSEIREFKRRSPMVDRAPCDAT